MDGGGGDSNDGGCVTYVGSVDNNGGNDANYGDGDSTVNYGDDLHGGGNDDDDDKLLLQNG